MTIRIGNFIHEIEAGPDAPQVSGLLAALADIDGQRIGSNDQIVIRKAVLGLLAVVGGLEARVAALESPFGRADSDDPAGRAAG